MTASTPPLVDVIAGVLREHPDWGYELAPERIVCQGCDWGQVAGGDLNGQPAFQAHQARAVLDALTKAGGVELTYGLQHSNGCVRECRDLDEARALKGGTKVHGRRGDWANHTIVSKEKLSVTGPWEPC